MGDGSLKYGIRHRPQEDVESHILRRFVIGIAIITLISLISTRGCLKGKPNREKPVAPTTTLPQKPAPQPVATVTNAPTVAKPPPIDVLPKQILQPPDTSPKKLSPEARLARKWLETAETRDIRDRTLLERLAVAEQKGNVFLAVDSIVTLRKSPAMADLDDALAWRLGELNRAILFSGRPTEWTVKIEVRPGDTITRIAREHRSTVAAVRRLNGLSENDNPIPGTKIRVLEFLRAALVIRKKTLSADLTLNGKFFRRYHVKAEKTPVGAYPISREKGPLTRFAELGITFSEKDRAELSMFLAPGSSLTVADF